MVFDRGTDSTFATVEAYDAARAAGELPADAPELPACAADIVVDGDGANIARVAFFCPGTTLDDAYVAAFRSQLSWDVLVFEDGRVELEKATNEEGGR